MFILEKKEINDFPNHLAYRAYCKKRLEQQNNYLYREKKKQEKIDFKKK